MARLFVINSKNILRAAQMINTNSFSGIVQHGKVLLVEYVSLSKKISYVSAFWRDKNVIKAAHSCRAVSVGNSCWHMAVAYTFYRLMYGSAITNKVMLQQGNVRKIPSGGRIILSGAGDMKLLSPDHGGGKMINVNLCIEDILELRPDLSEDQAQKFLDKISDDVVQAMLAAGWDVIAEKAKAV